MPRLTSFLQERVIIRSPFWLQLQSITIIPSGILRILLGKTVNKWKKEEKKKSNEERLKKKKDKIEDDEFIYPLNQLNLIK